jgi:hypothetical protein
MKNKTLKSILVSILALAMIMVVFADYGSSAEPVLTAPVTLTFSTQDVGGAMYVYASVLASIWSQALPAGSRVDVLTTSPGGVGAPIIIQNEDADITLGNAAPAKWAYEEGILGHPPTRNVRAIAGGLGTDFVNVLFTQSFVNRTGITTMEELIEKQHPVRIVAPPPGSFGELAARHVLGALGVDYDTVRGWGGSAELLSWDAIVAMLRDDRADIVLSHVGAGQPATTELTMTTNMFFPQLAQSTLDGLVNVGFAPVGIPAGSWNGQEEAIQSVGSQVVVLVHASLPDDLIYFLVRSISTPEGRQEMVNAHAGLAAFNPASAHDALLLGAPIHPGAEAAYRAMGYMR